MKVGIDVSAMDAQSKGRGIGFYTENLVKALKKYTSWEVEVIENKVKVSDVNLIHNPFFDFFKPTLRVDSDLPTVITIHDVIPLLFPSHYPAGLKGRVNLLRQKFALRKVKAVITDSKTSTQDVIKVLQVPKTKVFTVYLAPGDQFKIVPATEIKRVREKYDLPEKFILYTGGVNWNKNLVRMAQAVLDSGLPLVVVGRGFETEGNLDHPELQPLKEFRGKFASRSDVKILGFVPGEDLVGIMNTALGLLLVSHYEGFGLPILEAQACGTAVIAGNNSSLKEVTGEGGLLVDAAIQSDITKALEKLKDQTKRRELIHKGTKNLERFSWEKTALETVKAYEYALSQK